MTKWFQRRQESWEAHTCWDVEGGNDFLEKTVFKAFFLTICLFIWDTSTKSDGLFSLGCDFQLGPGTVTVFKMALLRDFPQIHRMFPLGHKMAHSLGPDLLVYIGAELPHSINFVLGSENSSYHLLSSSGQEKKRAVTCFTSLSKQHSSSKGMQGPAQHWYPESEDPHIPHQAAFHSPQQSCSPLFPSWPKPSPFNIYQRDANTGSVPEDARQLSSSEGCHWPSRWWLHCWGMATPAQQPPTGVAVFGRKCWCQHCDALSQQCCSTSRAVCATACCPSSMLWRTLVFSAERVLACACTCRTGAWKSWQENLYQWSCYCPVSFEIHGRIPSGEIPNRSSQ